MTDHLETTRSSELADRLRRVLPGGDTRSATFYPPYPIAFARGEGYRVWDLDGNEYIDLVNNFTSLAHGHAHPRIVAALTAQTQLGTAFPAPNEHQAELAERLCARVPSVELLRYTNSGSEAVMLAVRAARAFTGRDLIVKADGGYHGCWEQVPMTTGVGIGSQGGTPNVVTDMLRVCEFNNSDSLRALMQEDGARVAAIVLEPVQVGGGVIVGEPEFFRAARELADEFGALLVLDEIVTLRLHPNGYQAVLGVRPDLTTMGKVIGGGLPVGVAGGRREVMELLDPRRPGFVGHSGTFNGNPMTCTAGCQSLDLLDEPAIARINGLGARLADGLRELVAERGLDGDVTRCGSLVQLHLETGGSVQRFSDINPGSALLARVHRAALAEGLFFAGRGLMCTSTVMDESVIDRVLDGFSRAVDRVESERALEAV